MTAKKSLKGAAKAVRATTKDVVKKAEKALKPMGDAIASEAKAVKKTVKRVVKKAGDALEPVTEALAPNPEARKAPSRTKRSATAKRKTTKKAR